VEQWKEKVGRVVTCDPSHHVTKSPYISNYLKWALTNPEMFKENIIFGQKYPKPY
jgi:hypothetical protein